MLLNATLPRIFQRKVLRWLPAELGQYLLEAGKGFALGGEIALVSPLSATAMLTHTRGSSSDNARNQVVTDTNTLVVRSIEIETTGMAMHWYVPLDRSGARNPAQNPNTGLEIGGLPAGLYIHISENAIPDPAAGGARLVGFGCGCVFPGRYWGAESQRL